ncbi:MAG TPA: tetratricopeptide repeat protein [Thermoanaerobaculia bacterium]|nr:tetratricopeptide repeat protein [Thermoanaerobaculia bacterium]
MPRRRPRPEVDRSAPLASSPRSFDSGRAAAAIAAIAIALITVWVFLPVTGFGYVNYDDPNYLRDNAIVLDGLTAEGVSWAFGTFHTGNWHPLTWLSHMADVELLGPEPGRHHATGLALHVVSSLLLLFLVRAWTGSAGVGAAVAALFAWHPAHVESVAWLSERKDVLSALFLWLALGAYTAYARRSPGAPALPRLALVALGLALALMAKPMAVTAPFLMLLLDVWPLGRLTLDERPTWARLRPLLFEKLPLFALVALSSVVTFVAQSRGGGVSSLEVLPLTERLGHAAVSVVTYLRMLVWPAGLAVFYPHRGAPASLELAGAVLLLAALTFAAWRARRSAPFLLVGWLWFVGTLVPVIGLVQVGEQSVADRYTYVPYVGLALALADGVRRVGTRRAAIGIALAAAGGVALLALAPVARGQVGYWRDGATLFRRALDVTDENHVAERLLGAALLSSGDAAGAEPHLREAVRLRPGSAEALNALGVALTQLGRPGDAETALEAFRRAATADPADAAIRNNLGNALAARGDAPEALAEFREAARLAPDAAAGHRNAGLTLAEMRRFEEARVAFEQAARLEPENAATIGDLANVLAQLGRADEALARYREALRLDPSSRLVRHNLARLLARAGRLDEATTLLAEGLARDPADEEGRLLLVRVRAVAGATS